MNIYEFSYVLKERNLLYHMAGEKLKEKIVSTLREFRDSIRSLEFGPVIQLSLRLSKSKNEKLISLYLVLTKTVAIKVIS